MTKIIRHVRKSLGTGEQRLYGGSVSRRRIPVRGSEYAQTQRQSFFPGDKPVSVLTTSARVSPPLARAFISPSSVTLYLSPSALRQAGGRVPSRLFLPDLSTQSTGTRTGRQRFIQGTIGGFFDDFQTKGSGHRRNRGQLQWRRPRRAESAAAGQRAPGNRTAAALRRSRPGSALGTRQQRLTLTRLIRQRDLFPGRRQWSSGRAWHLRGIYRDRPRTRYRQSQSGYWSRSRICWSRDCRPPSKDRRRSKPFRSRPLSRRRASKLSSFCSTTHTKAGKCGRTRTVPAHSGLSAVMVNSRDRIDRAMGQMSRPSTFSLKPLTSSGTLSRCGLIASALRN